jgi:iron complex outermembrane recepter protein
MSKNKLSKPAILRKNSLSRMPLTAAIYLALGGLSMAHAQDSIQVLDTQTLQERNVNDFEDYAKLLPSLSYQTGEGGTPTPYFRGVVSGNDGNHSASSPSVGVYLDEQPVTTIGGALDIHLYDIQRLEALAGPQGTLYGASSQSGTLKIVTNKPNPAGFSAGIGLEANSISGGGDGHVAEAYVNLPLGDSAAIRLVGFDKREAGYVDNVFGRRTFPSSGITIDNANRVKENYNSANVSGFRAALRVDLTENWSILPTVMMQKRKANGSFGFDPVVGDLKITHFYPESSNDEWIQAALTVSGKIGNFDITYAFASLDRDINSQSDYNDYGFWYDTVAGYGAYFYDNNGGLINPSQYIQAVDGYKKTSHELRIASPKDNRFRFIGGLFWQEQTHDIQQRYRVDNLSDSLEVTGWPDTIWLTKQLRTDKDKAVFGEFSFDFTDKLTGTLGFRRFYNDNALEGFFGFGLGYSQQSGSLPQDRYAEAGCAVLYGPNPALWQRYNGAPCKQFDKRVKENDTLTKFNLTYQFNDSKMIYLTRSEGYRPGGINRRATLPPYQSDFLTNLELGWKTTWLDNRLAFNGAIFRQDWDDFQFSILGQNGLTEIRNAAQARINGLEMDVRWRATYNLTLSAGVGFYDSKLTKNFCGWVDQLGNSVTACPAGTVNPKGTFNDTSDDEIVAGPQAPAGTRLPVTADFKGSVNARFEWDWGDYEPYVQLGWTHEGKRNTDLRVAVTDTTPDPNTGRLDRPVNTILGVMPAYDVVDFSAGIGKNGWTLSLYVKNLTDERAEVNRYTMCPENICGKDGYDLQYPNGQVYTVVNTPRTIGLRYTQEF